MTIPQLVVRRLVTSFLLFSVALSAFAHGQVTDGQASSSDEPARKPKPQVIQLTVSPAPSPRGALRIRLLPKYLDRKPGNRAATYRRAMLHSNQVSQDAQKKFYAGWEKWNKLPLVKLPRDEVREGLGLYESVLKEVEEGAWREHCDWDYRVREMTGMGIFSLLLPDIQELRHLMRVLSMRSRLEVAEGRLRDAEKTFQAMLQVSRDAAKQPFLISALVGMATAGVTASDLRHYVAHPKSPNLYWALTALPRPIISIRLAIEQEQSIPLQLFPLLRDAEKKRTPEQWRAALLEMVGAMAAFEGQKPSDFKAQLMLTAVLLKGYPMAKRRLIQLGRDRKEVEAMPAAQVVVLYLLDQYHYAWGEVFKCFCLPYPQAAQQWARAEKRLAAEGLLGGGAENTEIMPLTSLLLPAVSVSMLAEARTQRAIDELRAIEALRMFAAEHRRWPKSLSEITEVPVPDDPVTGKPFVYQRDGETAVLESAAPPGTPGQRGRRFELTLRKK